MSAGRNRAIIVGSGIAGLGAAVRLAAKGYSVDVFEAMPTPGGKLAECVIDGYRFDMGPSLFTMPHQVEDLFRTAGVPMEGQFSYKRMEVAFRYFWNDGTRLTGFSAPDQLAAEIERVFGEPAAAVERYLRRAARLLDSTGRTFLEHSLHRLSTLWRGGVPTALLHARPVELFGTLDQVNAASFSHPKVRQLFNRFASYNGSDPYRTPGVMRMIAGLEHGQGAFYPVEGMYSITRAIHGLGERLGVRYHFNSPVERILLDPAKRRATGVRVNGADHEADLVLSNMDVVPTYRRLLPDLPAPEKTLELERSSSAIVFYWGINREFKQLGLHNIFFSDDYQAEYRSIFHQFDVTDDPTIYVNITSKETPGDAPPGSENWFAMINAPCLHGQDRQALVHRTREAVITKLSRALGTDLRPHIAVEDVLDPQRILDRTGSHRGSIYGTASNSPWSTFLRHPNHQARVRGLYFCGGSVHPGAGIPISLLSARIATDMIPAAR